MSLSCYSTEQIEDFKRWEEYDDSEESFCQTDGECMYYGESERPLTEWITAMHE